MRLLAMMLIAAGLTGGAAADPWAGGQIGGEAAVRGWSGPDGQRGHQVRVPLTALASLDFGGAELDLTLKTGFVQSQYKGYGFKGSVSTWTDTVLGFNLGLPNAFGDENIRLFVTADLNLPTGKATLYGLQKLALMDPDLVDLSRFGEGFNANLLVGVTVALDDAWIVTLGGGYNYRGSYVPDGDQDLRYNPGEQIQALLTLDYARGDLAAQISAKYFAEEMGTLDGADYFNPGDRIDVSVNATYALDEASALQAQVFFSKSGKNQYLNFFTGVIETEAANGNGAIWAGTLSYIRQLDANVSANLFATYKVRQENDFDPVNDLFIPSRTQWSIGAGVDAVIAPNTRLSLTASAGQVRDDATVFADSTRTTTWSAGLGLTLAL